MPSRNVVFMRNIPAWEHAFKAPTGMTGRWTTKTMGRVTARAKTQVKPGVRGHGRTRINYATGDLAANTFPTLGKYGPGNDLEGRVVSTPKHALPLHEGAKAHVIVPKKAPKLVFFWAKAGRVVKLDKVNHPGNPPHRFLLEPLRKVVRTFR